MSERVDLAELRAQALASNADSFVHGLSLWVPVPTVLALVGAVEAAHEFWTAGEVIEVGDPRGFRLNTALSRFSGFPDGDTE